ncbi:MAG: type II toxin-antitoxin system RelE/ParE family toxin [Alphaproteobacteria bacterium]
MGDFGEKELRNPGAGGEQRPAPGLGRRHHQAGDALAKNPRPRGVKKLEGADDIYRLRVGDDRLLYRLREAALLVLVLAVGRRRDTYGRRRKK